MWKGITIASMWAVIAIAALTGVKGDIIVPLGFFAFFLTVFILMIWE